MTPISAKGPQSLIPLLAGLGTVVQVLVLLALAFASVVCWTIIVQKMRVLQKARRDNANFLHVFRTSNDLAFIAAAARRFAFSGIAKSRLGAQGRASRNAVVADGAAVTHGTTQPALPAGEGLPAPRGVW